MILKAVFLKTCFLFKTELQAVTGCICFGGRPVVLQPNPFRNRGETRIEALFARGWSSLRADGQSPAQTADQTHVYLPSIQDSVNGSKKKVFKTKKLFEK